MLFNLNYCTGDEFMDIIPDETKNFIYETMSILESFGECDRFTVLRAMICAIVSENSDLESDYIPLFEKYGFYPFDSEKDDNYDENKYIILFKIPNYTKVEYSILTPLAIIDYYVSSYGDNFNMTKLKELASIFEVSVNTLPIFFDTLSKYAKEEYDRLLSEKMNNLFADKSSEVTKYLETVGKIFINFTKSKNLKNIGSNIENMKALSYFLALFQYDTKERYCRYFIDAFKNKGLTLEKILDYYKLEKQLTDEDDYVLYLDEVFNCSYNCEDIKSIVNANLIDCSQTNIVPIKKMLSHFNISDNLLSIVFNEINEQLAEGELRTKEEYENIMTPDLVEYLDSAMKIFYYYVVMENGPVIDGKVIQSQKDYLVLSLLVNSYLYNGKLSRYFSACGINLEDIDKLTGKPVSDEELKDISYTESDLVKYFYSLLDKISPNIYYIKIDEVEDYITSYSNTETQVLNRLFYNITGNILPVEFNEVMNKYYRIEELKRRSNKIDEIFTGMNHDVCDFLDVAACIYKYKTNNVIFVKKNREVASLLLATWFNSDEEFVDNFRLYLESFDIDDRDVCEIFGIGIFNEFYNNEIFDPFVLEEHFMEFIFGGVNKGKDKSEITIESIIKNAFNKELNYSYDVENFLHEIGLNYSSFENIGQLVAQHKNEVEAKKDQEMIDNLKKLNIDYINVLKVAYIIYQDMLKQKDTIQIIDSEDEYKTTSILLAMFLKFSPNRVLDLFEERCINLEYILYMIKYDTKNLNITKEKIDSINLIEVFKEFFYISDVLAKNSNNFEKKNEEIELDFIVKKLFDSSDCALNKIIGDKDLYDNLFYSICTNENKAYKIPLDRFLKQLEFESQKDVVINCNNIDDMFYFLLNGDKSLAIYSKFIQAQYKEISECLNNDESIETIDSLSDKIYIDSTVKQGIFARIFKNSDKKVISRIVNSDVLEEITEELNTNITTLYIQIQKYREIFKAIDLYLKTIYKYKDSFINAQKYIEDLINKTTEDDFSRLIELKQLDDGIENKINSYSKSEILMKQQQVQIATTIINHMLSRGALQTCRDDIIPIIGSEMLFSISNNSGKNALELSNNLLKLFKSVIDQNMTDTMETLETIKSSDLPEDAISKIVTDFTNYMNTVTKSREDILKLSTGNEPVNEESSKVKKLERPKTGGFIL